jgi:hypothetical protein
MSRISYYLFFSVFVIHLCVAQQKSNDFTRRVGNFDGKFNRYSGKSFMNSKLNSKINNRIKIEDWPSKYSPFGGKRFVTSNSEQLIKKRIPWQKISPEFPFQERRSKVAEDRVLESDVNQRTAAVNSIEFRDAVYAQLDKRVDEWLSNVNNISLQEINRYQFRKGRPSEPGFPVQQAGSQGDKEVSSKAQPSNPTKLPSSGQQTVGSSYWLGPRKTSVQGGKQMIPQASPQPKPKGGYRTGPQPILGPKKIRVEVGTSK